MNEIRRRYRVIGMGVTAALVASFGVVGPAAAQEVEPTDASSIVASLVDEVALEQAVEGFTAGDEASVAELAAVVAPEPGVDVDVATHVSLEDGELLLAADGVVGEDGDDLAIGISYAGAQQTPEIVDGVAVSTQLEAGLDIVARATDDGAQVLAVLADENAPTELAFDLDLPEGATFEPLQDGSIAVAAPVANEEGVSPQYVGLIHAPWAVDAAGKALETSYNLVDGALIQTVVTDENTAFPVVADPKVTLGKLIYVKFNKSETKKIADSKYASKAKYAAAVCVVIPNPIAAAACGLISYDMHVSVHNTFKTAAKSGKCLEMGYLYTPQTLVSWKSVTC